MLYKECMCKYMYQWQLLWQKKAACVVYGRNNLCYVANFGAYTCPFASKQHMA